MGCVASDTMGTFRSWPELNCTLPCRPRGSSVTNTAPPKDPQSEAVNGMKVELCQGDCFHSGGCQRQEGTLHMTCILLARCLFTL